MSASRDRFSAVDGAGDEMRCTPREVASGRVRKICFVAPTTYPVFAGDRSIREVGGAQVQQSILAREFVRRGYEVSMISLNYGQPDDIRIDGVHLHRAHRPNEGIPVVRFIHPRLTSIWAAMRRADADIYYQRAAGALTSFVVAFARMHGRTSVYAAASDRDFFPNMPHITNGRDRALFRWGLRHADLLVAQTEAQRQSCHKNFGRDPAVIRSCYAHQGRPADPCGLILWVGSVIPVKRPELFVELARRLPQYRFKMIGGRDQDSVVRLRELAGGLRNIEFTGFIPFADIEEHFDGASILVNTSSNEGFPNTFLQSWSRGTPTVSFINPYAQSVGTRSGLVVGNLEEMAQAITQLKEDTSFWRTESQMMRKHFQNNFSVVETANLYEDLFNGFLWQRGINNSRRGASVTNVRR